MRITMLILMIIVGIYMGTTSSAGAQLSTTPPITKRVPHPPTREGCYRYEGQWREVPCASEDSMRKFPHPQWQFSIQSKPKNIINLLQLFGQHGPVTYSLPIAEAEIGLIVNFSGSEKDTAYGPNAWSIQTNTNFFPGNNGHTTWVQFVDQSRPGQGEQVCIWNIDVSTRSYFPTCVNPARTRAGGLQTNDVVGLGGYIAIGSLLTEVAYLPWTSTWWSVVARDKYGLNGNWNEVSGSIMGLGGGSQAIFGKTKIQTLVDAYSCSAGWTAERCPQGRENFYPPQELASYGIAYYSGVTAESNNLVPTNGPPPGNEPSTLQCVVDWCQLNYFSTAQ